MPHVRKSEILAVARELWGSTGILEDEAKLVLAEQLINDIWENKKSGIPLNMAGVPIKAALGDRWLTSSERQAAGKPMLRQVLADDPYFVLKDNGTPNPNVRLRVSRLSQLIGHPEMVEEYRWSPSSSHQQSAAASASSASAQGSSTSKKAEGVNSEGLPFRPGVQDCAHYLRHGWCLFKQDCWYHHPESRNKPKRVVAPVGSHFYTESHLEPGVMLLDGVYPMRPGEKRCGFFVKNGYCMFKAKCRNHHPSPTELATDQGSSLPTASAASAPDEATAPTVKQPQTQQLLGVVVDAVWPPEKGRQSAMKGALAKHILEKQLATGDVQDEAKRYELLLSQAGMFLNKWWQSHPSFDPSSKPYKVLADELAEDPLYEVSVNNKNAVVVHLLLGRLLDVGGPQAAAKLSDMADVVWPPLGGKEIWLRGRLAKWLLSAGFEGDNGRVLRQVLAVGPNASTVFRIDMAQAGEYLRRSWESGDHPYDASVNPWMQLKPLIAGDRFLYIEPAPHKANSMHVTVDLADMLNHYPSIARYTRPPTSRATDQAAGPLSPGSSTAGGSSSSRIASSSNAHVAVLGDDAINIVDDDSDEDGMISELTGGQLELGGGGSSRAAGAAGSSLHVTASPAATQGQWQVPQDVAEIETQLAEIASLSFEPPEHMQWWWPDDKPENTNCVWAEIAIRLLDPSADDAEMQLAEMVQHLEISPVLAVACATYKSHPHLLQFFAPYAAIGGLEMPAAVYLIDVLKPGFQVQQVLELIQPVLASGSNVKVCHGSKFWSGQLEKAFKIKLKNYFDTQQANFVWHSLRYESGRLPNMNQVALKNTAEVSLSSLLRTFDFFHPERHTDKANKDAIRVWQNRPLSEDLITCAAADVTYLLPLMEIQVRNLKLAALEVRKQQQQQRPGTRAASLLTSLPPELADTHMLATLAQGAEVQGAGLSLNRVQEWGMLDIFHQTPLHVAGMALNQSYGALRGRG